MVCFTTKSTAVNLVALSIFFRSLLPSRKLLFKCKFIGLVCKRYFFDMLSEKAIVWFRSPRESVRRSDMGLC